MGKNLITQARGKGSTTYRAPSHKYVGKICYRTYDESERNGVVFGKVVDLVDCPGHFAPLLIIKYDTKEEVLISAPLNIKVGDIVASGATAPVQTGNVLPLKNIPDGTYIYNLECKPGDGGKLVRTSGTFAKVVGKIGEGVSVMLPSKKQKNLCGECRATIGTIAGDGRLEKPFVKAGTRMHAMRARNKLYPQVSGVAMNAVDHPFGSGRGRHVGKPKNAPRWAPAGRNVGLIRAKRTGRKRR
ncbi:50S ribosomal protein L2 [Candidatus Woesearchaeota archaeon]|nr:50S ribosomal protein L2 [Candidatus Woesearchaeota archaeon]